MSYDTHQTALEPASVASIQRDRPYAKPSLDNSIQAEVRGSRRSDGRRTFDGFVNLNCHLQNVIFGKIASLVSS